MLRRLQCANDILLGIDIGSRSLRAGLYTSRGELLVSSEKGYKICFPQAGWAEQNPEEIWQALIIAIRQCLDMAGLEAANIVKGLCIVGTATTLVLCDNDGTPLMPSILWMDTRSKEEAKEISASNEELLIYSGGQVSPEWFLPKALWLKRHQKNCYNSASHITEITDWLDFRLTGRWAASLTTVSAEWSYVSHRGGWPIDLLASFDMEDLLLRIPDEIIEPGVPLGKLCASVADLFGLSGDVYVVKGMMDSFASSLAQNIFSPDRMCLSLGTSSSYMCRTDRPYFIPTLLGTVPDAFGNGIWVIRGGQTSAGSIMHWFTDELANGMSYQELDECASKVKPGCDGLVALDTWQGSRCPYRDPAARGALWGLNLQHSRFHIYRALQESIAFGGRQILEEMASIGVNPIEVWACGGGTRSELLTKIHADVFGLPITLSKEPEMAMSGAAICAAVGIGDYDHLIDAASEMVIPGRTITPNLSIHAIYDQYYREYKLGYPQLRESFQHICKLTTSPI